MLAKNGLRRAGGLALATAILAVALGVAVEEARAQATDDWLPVTIVYNSDVQGAIEQCGCKSNPRGGVARRATVLDGIWSEGQPVLMLDGGDLFGRRSRNEREQTRYLCRWTSEFGYDAIALGEADLNYGIAFLREMIDTYQLPYTNANVRDAESGELLLPEYLLIERGGIIFGVVSVMDPELPLITASAREETFQVDDPVAVLEDVLPRMREAGAQALVLLSHMGDRGTETLLSGVPEVDVCLVGHTRRPYRSERILHQAALIAASYEGRYMGRLNGFFDKRSGDLKAFDVEAIELNDTIASDPVMAERVDAFKRHLEEFRLAARGEYRQTLGSAEEAFLGERECRKCHGDVWDRLANSAHSQAMASLTRKGRQDAPECLVCHTTGYVWIGGYDDRPPANRMRSVQCEACHGYGTLHRRDGSMPEEARESCVTCHDQENSPEFEYAAYWAKIAH